LSLSGCSTACTCGLAETSQPRHLFLGHDLAQHRSSKVLRRFLCPLPCGTPHASRSCSGTGQSAYYDDSSDDTGLVCVDIPSCVSYARAHPDSHATSTSIASRSRRRLPPRRSHSGIDVGVQSLDGQSAARDAKARKAKVKIALLAQYSSKTCSTIDLSPVPTSMSGSRAEHGEKA
jgi:hypothetical protein